MKLLTGLLSGALAGLAVAGTPDAAEVYLLESHLPSSSNAAPRLPKEIARHILLQRTSRDRYGNALGDIPASIDQETAISYINDFGKPRAPLFGSTDDESQPSQLVVMLEGITEENVKPLKEALAKTHQKPAFSVADPPSSTANNRLFRDFLASSVYSPAGCTVSSAINPNDDSCWEGVSSAVKFDVRKVSDTIDVFIANLDRLSKFVSKGELEVALVLMPESSRSSGSDSWGSNPRAADELRRRDSEMVLTDGTTEQPAATGAAKAGDALPWALQEKNRPAIPQCFQSQNSCETRTNNCTGGHGKCINKYGEGAKETQVCFACHCVPQVIVEGEGEEQIGRTTVRWGGNMCHKKDVSSPFWLITGFTVTLVGILSFAIGLLFNIGEERLPGVIGAGVSRSK